jgi:hypothetical protein
MLSGVTAATLATTLLAGVGPATAAEAVPEPITGIEAVETAEQAAADLAVQWEADADAPVTAEAQAAAGMLFFLDARRNQHVHAIHWAFSAGITTGWPVEGSNYPRYRPSAPVNRDAMAAFLYRLAGSPDYTPPAVSPFRDVPTSTMFYKEIAWLAEQGIARGWTDGTYRPWEPVNRDAMAAFLYRAAGTPHYDPPADSTFRDVTPGQEHYKEIAWLAAKGISTGWADGTYRPVEAVKRDAMAAFLYRYAVPEWRTPTPTALEKVPVAHNGGFTFRSARLDGYDLGPSAIREFSAQEQTVLDLDTAGAGYEKIETVFAVEDGHEDPEALYRVQVYYEDRIREIADVRPGHPVVYDDASADQDRIRFEVTKLAGTGTSTFVLGGARMLSDVTPDLLHPDRYAPHQRVYFLSHFDEQPEESFDRRPEAIAGEYFPNSLSYAGIEDTPHLLEHPLQGERGFTAEIGLSDRSADPSTQYQLRVLSPDGAEQGSYVVAAGAPRWVTVGVGQRLEATRVAGTGEAFLVLGDARFWVSGWPLQTAP